LRTASLDSQETMAAFPNVINAMVGTGASAKQMARAIAGAYNTMGKQMSDTMSISEKFQKITDALTFTYATQDVEMSELIAGYEKLAPYLSGVEDNFTEMVTVIGFLNTRMLRGGRTGRLLGRSMIQLNKNLEKLASTFGITFDPKQPLNFLNIMKQIGQQIGLQGKVTAEQSARIQEVFAMRGGVPIRLLAPAIVELSEALELAGDSIDGFTQRIAEMRMNTVRAQMERMANQSNVLFNYFLQGAAGSASLATELKRLNDRIEASADRAKTAGMATRFFLRNLLALHKLSRLYLTAPGRLFSLTAKEDLDRIMRDIIDTAISWKEIVESSKKATEQYKSQEKLRKAVQYIEDYNARLQANRVLQTEAELDALKALGVSERQILHVRLLQLQALEGAMNPIERQTQMEKVRYQIQLKILEARNKELSLIMKMERGEIAEEDVRRLTELGRFSPQLLAERYRIDERDKQLMIQNARFFSNEVWNIIAQQIAARQRIGLTQFEFQLPRARPEYYQRAAQERLGTYMPPERAAPQPEFITPTGAQLDINFQFRMANLVDRLTQNITIHLPEAVMENIARGIADASAETLFRTILYEDPLKTQFEQAIIDAIRRRRNEI
jgi:hypothetical protein